VLFGEPEFRVGKRISNPRLGVTIAMVALEQRSRLQGLGIAKVFMPLSQLAYSNPVKNKNNNASSFTNLFRNQGRQLGNRVGKHAGGRARAIPSKRAGSAQHAF
jgi:hypothetical protein